MRKKVKKLNSRLTDSDSKDQSRGTVSLMAFSIFSSLNNWVKDLVIDYFSNGTHDGNVPKTLSEFLRENKPSPIASGK